MVFYQTELDGGAKLSIHLRANYFLNLRIKSLSLIMDRIPDPYKEMAVVLAWFKKSQTGQLEHLSAVQTGVSHFYEIILFLRVCKELKLNWQAYHPLSGQVVNDMELE